MSTTTLESELRELQDTIRREEANAERLHEQAESVVEGFRRRGINPALDNEAFAEVDAAYKPADQARDNVAELRARAEKIMERHGKAKPAARPGSPATMAGRVHESTGYQAFSQGGQLPNVEVMTREEAVQYFTATADVTGAPQRDPQDFIVPIPVRPVRLLDLISVGTTDGDTVTYIEETTRTDAAAETALGTAYSEASYVYTERTSVVRDIGHFTPAHRSNLADMGVLQSLLSGRVLNGVQRRLEQQAYSGDASGSNLRGIVNTSGIGTVAKGAEPRIETLHKAITNIRLNFFDEPDAIVLHPNDYEEVVFEKDANGLYLLGGPASRESPTVWGKPILASAVATQNTGLVGAFKQGGQLWLRSGVEIRTSDSHSTYFTERRVAILGEQRAAFAAWQPKGFCTATGI